MRKHFFLFVFVLFIYCKDNIPLKDFELINGYWEIEKVEMPNGKIKKYSYNETLDYFNVSNLQGFRKKITLRLNGKHLTNNLKENIKISFKNNNAILNCTTRFDNWEEEIVSVNDSSLVLKNPNNIKYFYKKVKLDTVNEKGK